jgi:hypothetical protein
MKTAHKTKPSAEEINQAIAEALGWVWYRLPEYRYETRKHRFLALPSIHEYEGQDPAWTVRADMTENVCNWEYMQREFHVPNYWGDLNAIHEAWFTQPIKPFTDTFNFYCEMAWQLILIVERDFNLNKIWSERGFEPFCNQIGTAKEYWIANATAPQRCEAFLRALGKWRWV